MRIKELIGQIEKLIPRRWATDSDNVGHIISIDDKEVTAVVLSLDLTSKAVDIATNVGANLIITHHPAIPQAVSWLDSSSPPTKEVTRCIRYGINVYSAHTNLDAAPDGVSFRLAKKLGFNPTSVLLPRPGEKLLKLTVYIPEDHLKSFSEGMFSLGVGQLGRYSEASFFSKGTGTFKPEKGAHPFIGEIGKRTETSEYRWESILRERDIQKAIEGIRRFHPYEEPAYDITPLLREEEKAGFGCICQLERSTPFSELAAHIHNAIPTAYFILSGDTRKEIKLVAILGGSANSLTNEIISSGVDCLVTGELGYHNTLLLLSAGINCVQIGHFASEIWGLGKLDEVIREIAPGVQVITNLDDSPYAKVTEETYGR